MANPPSKNPGKKKGDYLEGPYVPGDAIPTPDVVEGTGDSAWALWSEISHQHERRFADTAPASVLPMHAPTTGGWARTEPASLGRLGQQPAHEQPAEPLMTVETAMLVARKNNRVCPRPQQWDGFAAALTAAAGSKGVREPVPAAATGPAWRVTPPLTKRLCFREQIEWAGRHGLLEDAMEFMQQLAEAQWLHMGEDA